MFSQTFVTRCLPYGNERRLGDLGKCFGWRDDSPLIMAHHQCILLQDGDGAYFGGPIMRIAEELLAGVSS